MTVNPADSAIYGGLYGSDELRALFGDRHRLQCMLDVEAALARAEAKLGLVPPEVAAAITAAASVDRLDLAAIAKGTRGIGHPPAALAKELGRLAGGEAPRYVHWGATTQDIVDTATVLQARAGLRVIERDLHRLCAALADRAARHRRDVMAGRTLMQQALPITFGYKCAVWLAPLLDHLERLAEARRRVLVVQFAGAVGTLASLGDRGRAVVEALAAELDLAAPVAPWHADRSRIVELGALLALICGSVGKIATDVVLMAQTEVGELTEPAEAGRGGSSTMPHKRNPVGCTALIAAVRGVQTMLPLLFAAEAGEHERAAGAWHSESFALPQMFVLAGGILAQAAELVEGMGVDAVRMRTNLDITRGLLMSEAVSAALAPHIGREQAHHLVEAAARRAVEQGRDLTSVLGADPKVAAHLDAAAIARAMAPDAYLGEADAVIDRVMARQQMLPSPLAGEG